MINQMYFQTGLFNAILVLIVLHRVYEERNQFQDCKLFTRLMAATFFTIVLDTAGWMMEGRFLGPLKMITNVTDGLNLIMTAAVCWCWVQYAQYLAYEDAGIPGHKNYFSTILFGVHAFAIMAAIPTSLFYYIDETGHYVRSTGYSLTIIFCLIQLFYSIVICLATRKKVQSKAKRKELLLIGWIIIFPIAATIVQGFLFGTSLIWTCMTIVLLIIYIHIQDKRRALENEEQQEQLKLALRQAQYASKAKTDFLSNMSHDIRTPMNAIVGFTAIAASHIDEKNIVQDSLSKIMSSSNHLLNLINDVLDMSRIESGKMHLQVAPCNLAFIMHDLVDMIQSQIRANQLDLFIDTIHVKDENILTDAMKLNQIFINLVGNAIKFNKPGGIISIRIEQKETATAGMANYVFTVKDTGCGIAKEYVDHIFEPFERGVQDEAKDSVEGTGLGLTIVKNIVDMMGGTISVSSELGKGTEFTLGLSFGLQPKKEANMNYRKLQGLRALVVDDDYNTCDSVSTMLHEIGMNAEWTLTGKEAVLKAKKASEIHKGYAAFIIDWLIPDMNGIEVTRRIRSVIGQETPIFILTAYDWSDIEQEAKEAGVTAFCRKPLFMSELRQTLMESSGMSQTEDKMHYEENRYEKLTGKRILLVEDHPLNREIAVRLLTDKGIKVEEAEDGCIAVEKFKLSREHYYDLILMDIRMPNMDGYQATDCIRELDREDAKIIPVVAMTANAFEEDKQMALDHGMNAHLTKPLNVKILFDTIGKYLSSKEA